MLAVYMCARLLEFWSTIWQPSHLMVIKNHTHIQKCRHSPFFVASHPNLIIRLNCPLFRDEHRFFVFCFSAIQNWIDIGAFWQWDRNVEKPKARLVFNVRILRLLSRQNDFGRPKMASDIWSDKLTLRSIWFDLSIDVWVCVYQFDIHRRTSCIVFHTIFNVASPLPIKAFVLICFLFISFVESNRTEPN